MRKVEATLVYEVKEDPLKPGEMAQRRWFTKTTMNPKEVEYHSTEEKAREEARKLARWGYTVGVYSEAVELVTIFEPIKNQDGD